MARKWILKGYKVRPVLKICGVAASTYYYQHKQTSPKQLPAGGRPVPGYSLTFTGEKVTDAHIKRCIVRLLEGEESVYGYRKLTLYLRREYGLRINKKKAYRLCKELEILGKMPVPKTVYPKRLANNREVTAPNQLWQMDIKYGYVAGLERYFYTASIIDVYDRCIVGQYRGKEAKTETLLTTLRKSMEDRKISNEHLPLVIRTDNGPQFKSHAFRNFCEDNPSLIHERTPNRTPNKNAYIESFHSILERECFKRHIFMTFEEAYETLDRFMDFYNKRRIHMSLYGYSPVQFLEKLAKNEVKAFKLKL